VEWRERAISVVLRLVGAVMVGGSMAGHAVIGGSWAGRYGKNAMLGRRHPARRNQHAQEQRGRKQCKDREPRPAHHRGLFMG
jgi:hypothetical protein